MSLYDLIQDPDKRRTVVDDSNLVLEAEVRSKGFMVKTAFKVVKGIKPGFIPMAIDNLLDDFSQQLDPHYATWDQGGRSGTLEQHFVKNGEAIANDLLSVTDHRAATAKSKKAMENDDEVVLYDDDVDVDLGDDLLEDEDDDDDVSLDEIADVASDDDD